jgi:hypothetical protein
LPFYPQYYFLSRDRRLGVSSQLVVRRLHTSHEVVGEHRRYEVPILGILKPHRISNAFERQQLRHSAYYKIGRNTCERISQSPYPIDSTKMSRGGESYRLRERRSAGPSSYSPLKNSKPDTLQVSATVQKM